MRFIKWVRSRITCAFYGHEVKTDEVEEYESSRVFIHFAKWHCPRCGHKDKATICINR